MTTLPAPPSSSGRWRLCHVSLCFLCLSVPVVVVRIDRVGFSIHTACTSLTGILRVKCCLMTTLCYQAAGVPTEPGRQHAAQQDQRCGGGSAGLPRTRA